MVTYDSRGMTWDQWNKLTEELFAQQQLGNVPEERWRDWVDGLIGVGYFQNSGVADHRGFNTWQEWADHFLGTMSINYLV
jgi:hypothetical protein